MPGRPSLNSVVCTLCTLLQVFLEAFFLLGADQLFLSAYVWLFIRISVLDIPVGILRSFPRCATLQLSVINSRLLFSNYRCIHRPFVSRASFRAFHRGLYVIRRLASASTLSVFCVLRHLSLSAAFPLYRWNRRVRCNSKHTSSKDSNKHLDKVKTWVPLPT